MEEFKQRPEASEKVTNERSETLMYNLFKPEEVGNGFLGRAFTENEKSALQAGHDIHWKKFDLGGTDKALTLRMHKVINPEGNLESVQSVQLKADKLEIPKEVMGKKLNQDEKDKIAKGGVYCIDREGKKFLLSIDSRVNSVTIRTPAEVGIKENLGEYTFSSNELSRLKSNVEIGPKVFKSDKYGYFASNLKIEQKGNSYEYKYSNIVNLTPKEAEKLKPILNKHNSLYDDNEINKIMDVMGVDNREVKFAFEENIKNSKIEPQLKDGPVVNEVDTDLGKRNFKSLEKYEGELDGVYQTKWLATNDKGNFFITNELEFKGVNVPDFEETKWSFINNEYHSKITEEMRCTKNFAVKEGKINTPSVHRKMF